MPAFRGTFAPARRWGGISRHRRSRPSVPRCSIRTGAGSRCVSPASGRTRRRPRSARARPSTRSRSRSPSCRIRRRRSPCCSSEGIRRAGPAPPCGRTGRRHAGDGRYQRRRGDPRRAQGHGRLPRLVAGGGGLHPSRRTGADGLPERDRRRDPVVHGDGLSPTGSARTPWIAARSTGRSAFCTIGLEPPGRSPEAHAGPSTSFASCSSSQRDPCSRPAMSSWPSR